jgi:hypothetical protein
MVVVYFSENGPNTVTVSAVAKFIVPDRGDKVDSGIGLSYRPVEILCTITGCRHRSKLFFLQETQF